MITIVLDPEEIIRDSIMDVMQGNATDARKLMLEDGYCEERLDSLIFREYEV